MKIIIIAALALCMVGCETITGSLYYADAESGAKGGLTFRPTGTGWWVRAPFQDESGNEGGLNLGGEIIVRDEK